MADPCAAGRDAFARMEWAEAYEGYRRADSVATLDMDDLEQWATAAYLSGHDRHSTDLWERCHRCQLEGGEPERAVHSAFWVGFGLMQRGEMARGGGWIAQASGLVEEHDLMGVGRGYLLLPASLMNLDSGDFSDAHDGFEQAGAIADTFGDDDLRALSRLGRGQALFCLGRRDAGARLFDRAMVSVTRGQVSPVVAGIVYCGVIDLCQQAFDVARAREWTAALTQWCDDQPGLVPYRGQCLVHRAQVLQLHGAWPEAMEQARRAQERLSESPHPAIGMAHYQLGELLRLRGDLPAAEAAYREAQRCGRPPEPGLALVRLAQGDIKAAAAAIDAAVAEAGDRVTEAGRLPAFVEIMLAADRGTRAREAADRLAAIAADAESPYLAAAAAQADGAVLLAADEPRAALARLRWSWRRWQALETPYEAARVQVLVAAACDAMGDGETAQLERDSAHRTFTQLGAAVELDRMGSVAGSTPTDVGDTGVSPRELQVLRRIARGRTNREIGEELFISTKTVERHVSNLMTKLGASNRAAATAIGYERDLL